VLNKDQTHILNLDGKPEMDESDPKKKREFSPKSKRNQLRKQQKCLVTKFRKVKQMTIDYYCRQDLSITTLKEFFEIFISSLKKDQAFHQELINKNY
jgi:hypothetical protein